MHEFDAIRFLTGEESKTVQVRSGRCSQHAPQRDPQQVLVETEGGVLADVEIFVNAQLGYKVKAEAVFERDTVTIGEDTGPRVSSDGRWGGAVPPGFVERFAAAYDAQVQSWVDAAQRGEVGGPTAWDGYAAACCCEAGVAAQRSSGTVVVGMRSRPDD